MMEIVAVLVMGALGGMLRFALEDSTVISTLLINLTGAFLLGYFIVLTQVIHLPKWLNLGLNIGLIGSFTTFSTFAADAAQLWATQPPIHAVLYVVASIAGGIALSGIGQHVANTVHASSSVTKTVRRQ